MRELKFIAKLREQGTSSRVITIPLYVARNLKLGECYQFQIEVTPV